MARSHGHVPSGLMISGCSSHSFPDPGHPTLAMPTKPLTNSRATMAFRNPVANEAPMFEDIKTVAHGRCRSGDEFPCWSHITCLFTSLSTWCLIARTSASCDQFLAIVGSVMQH